MTLVWYENDLRTADHPALESALAGDTPVLPVFVWAGGSGWAEGAASRWWLHHSLLALREDLTRLGLPLVVRRGDPVRILMDLAEEAGATRVVWNTRPEPDRAGRDERVVSALRDRLVRVDRFPGALLHDPDRVRTTSGGPYQVFTPFYRRLRESVTVGIPAPGPAATAVHAPDVVPTGLEIEELGLLPADRDTAGWSRVWRPGEAGAIDRLDAFVSDAVLAYADRRDRPAVEGTSRLSPHLHFGEITPARIWNAIRSMHGETRSTEPFLRQLAWREFAHHVLHHFPTTPAEPLRSGFDCFPWKKDAEALERWRQGQTGYPIVDAGMRELRATGWMHNRVRMIVASFLTKDLLLPWQDGAEWFQDTLVDADLANNTFGWQWTAGCGADAAPYFRIFNPVTQGERFDPDGQYVKHWIPEMESMPDRYVHAPWKAPATVLANAGVIPGRTIPDRIVDHASARERALEAYEVVRDG